MKGRTKTKAESELHDQLREHGCAVCRYIIKPDIDFFETPAIHHISGKTKAGAHRLVIPLCATHHQYGTAEHPSIHANGSVGGKAQFKQAYGVDEYDLLAMCEQGLGCEYRRTA